MFETEDVGLLLYSFLSKPYARVSKDKESFMDNMNTCFVANLFVQTEAFFTAFKGGKRTKSQTGEDGVMKTETQRSNPTLSR